MLAYGGLALGPRGGVYLGWQMELPQRYTVPPGRGRTNKTRGDNTRRVPVALVVVVARHQKAELQPSTGHTDKKQPYNYGPRLQVGQKDLPNTQPRI